MMPIVENAMSIPEVLFTMDNNLDLFDFGSLGQSIDTWPIDENMNDVFDFGASTIPSTGIEHNYADIHKSLDALLSISHDKMPQLEHVRQQNRRVYDKLTNLEEVILRRTPPASRADSLVPEAYSTSSSPTSSDTSSRRHSEQVYVSFSPSKSPERKYAAANFGNTGNFGTTTVAPGTLTPVSLVQSPEPYRSLVNSPVPSNVSMNRSSAKRRRICPSPDTQSVTDNRSRKTSHATSSASEQQPEMGRSSRLAQKMLQIGNADSVARLDEFQQQLTTPQSRSSMTSLSPRYGFPNFSHVGNGSEFLRMLPSLAMAIECNIFGEQNHRIYKRIALSHFYQAYTLAQDNPETFLSWCNDQHLRRSTLLPKGGYKSIVQHRFADLMFPHRTLPQHSSDSKKGDNLKAHIGKIQTWRKNGKQWAKMILRFGYGILLLVPSNLTDEDLRVAHDEDIAYILDKLDTRRYLFEDALQRANGLLRHHFFAEQTSQQTIGLTGVAACDDVDWSEFFPAAR